MTREIREDLICNGGSTFSRGGPLSWDFRLEVLLPCLYQSHTIIMVHFEISSKCYSSFTNCLLFVLTLTPRGISRSSFYMPKGSFKLVSLMFPSMRIICAMKKSLVGGLRFTPFAFSEEILYFSHLWCEPVILLLLKADLSFVLEADFCATFIALLYAFTL